MPNSANRSNGNNNSNKGQRHPAEKDNKTDQQKPNPERSDIKHDTAENDGNTDRTSNQGRKEASGGRVEE